MRRRISKSGNHGSIPVLFIIAVGIGTVVIPSVYSGRSAVRQDLEIQMREQADQIASSAIEEIFVKIVQGNRECLERAPGESPGPKMKSYKPDVTRYMIERAYPGAEVGNVTVVATPLEQRTDESATRDFEELLSAVPAFHVNDGQGHDPAWFKSARLQGLDLAGLGLDLKGRGEEYLSREHVRAADGRYIARRPPSAADLLDERIQKDGKLIGDAAGEIAEAFHDLMPVSEKNPLPEFKRQWETVMRALSKRADMRIQSAGGDPVFALVTVLSALAKGSRPNRFTPGENDFRFATMDCEAVKVSRSLVTAEAQARVRNGLVDAEEKVTVHRIVQSNDFKAVYERVRTKVALYLIAHYNLSVEDLESMGWAEKQGNRLQGLERLFYPLSARFPDIPSPRVRPFQVAAS